MSDNSEPKNHCSYEHPLVSRYASKEMSVIWSTQKKFSTWRKLWLVLAESEKSLGRNISNEQVTASKNIFNSSLHWHRVTYNPYKHDYFMLGEEEVPRDWVGNINMESLYHEHGVASRVYI